MKGEKEKNLKKKRIKGVTRVQKQKMQKEKAETNSNFFFRDL